ncbi:hypothetical protein FHG87_019351, partial [Trinorchestia longiramus]
MKETSELPLGPTVFSPNIPQMYHFCKYAPLPDTCNSGPVIACDRAGSAGTSNFVCEPKVVIRKRSNPPPWQATKPCSTPCCSAHIPITSLSHPDPLLSWQERRRFQYGNLLQCLRAPDDNLQLFQAVNTEEGSIVSLYDVPLSCESQLTLNERQISFQKNYEVYDLQCLKVQNETFMLNRGSHQVDLHRLCNDSLEFCNAEWKSDVLLTGTCLSQTYSGKWLETNECQKVSLKNCERIEPCIWSQDLPDSKIPGREKEWCSALFAYEDSIAVATNRTKMYLCDFRKEKPDCLLDIHHKKHSEKIDEICSMARTCESPYVFLVMSRRIWLVDERRCDQPVISWNHLLLDQPRRSVLQSMPGLDILMLSNNLEPRVAFASVRGLNFVNETAEQYVWSPSLIFHHDFMGPMKTFAHKKGLWFDYRVSERLSKFENSGLATAKSPGGEHFTVFSSNNAGDVFCQKFNYENTSLESHSTSDKTSAVVKRMKAYERMTKKLFCEQRREEQKLDVTSTVKARLCVGNEPPVEPPLWDVSSTIVRLKQGSSHSKALDGSLVFKWTDHLVENYNDDPNFMSIVGDNEITDAISKYFHSKTVEITGSEWIKSRSDELAQKILNFWPLVDTNDNKLTVNCEEVDKDLWYRSVPYGKRFGRSDYVKKCRPRSSKGSSTGNTMDGASSSGSRSLSEGGYSTQLSQELLDASAAAAVPSAVPNTPLPSTTSQELTPLFRQTPSGLTSTTKKK